MSLLLATGASADQVINNLDATLQTLNVNVGGSSGSVDVVLNATNNDSKNGCNLTGSGKQLVVSVASADTTIATVLPSSLTITDCGGDWKQAVTVSPVGAGTTTINFTYSSHVTSTSGITAADFNVTPADFTVVVGAGGGSSCTTPADPTFTSPSSVPASGWFTTAPTVAASGTNVEYATQTSFGGVLGTKSSFSSTAPSLGQGTTIVYARSVDGTCISGEVSITIKVDGTAPALNVTAPSGTYDLCTAGIPAAATFNPSDSSLTHDSSGVNSDPLKTYITTTAPSTASGAGLYNWNARAEDNATNFATALGSYRVAYGSAMTFPLSPINADGTSRFRLGSTVPVKLTLSCNGVSIDNAVASLTVKKKDNTANPGVDEAISTAASTTGNLFRYSADGAQYIFNLSTKSGYEQINSDGTKTTVSFSTGSWILQVNLDDGTSRQIEIQLVK